MLVREVMTSPVYTVLPSTTVKEALQILELLRERNALDSLGQEPDRGPLPAR